MYQNPENCREGAGEQGRRPHFLGRPPGSPRAHRTSDLCPRPSLHQSWAMAGAQLLRAHGGTGLGHHTVCQGPLPAWASLGPPSFQPTPGPVTCCCEPVLLGMAAVQQPTATPAGPCGRPATSLFQNMLRPFPAPHRLPGISGQPRAAPVWGPLPRPSSGLLAHGARGCQLGFAVGPSGRGRAGSPLGWERPCGARCPPRAARGFGAATGRSSGNILPAAPPCTPGSGTSRVSHLVPVEVVGLPGELLLQLGPHSQHERQEQHWPQLPRTHPRRLPPPHGHRL